LGKRKSNLRENGGRGKCNPNISSFHSACIAGYAKKTYYFLHKWSGGNIALKKSYRQYRWSYLNAKFSPFL
jgi:uncharacterized protein YvpB